MKINKLYKWSKACYFQYSTFQLKPIYLYKNNTFFFSIQVVQPTVHDQFDCRPYIIKPFCISSILNLKIFWNSTILSMAIVNMKKITKLKLEIRTYLPVHLEYSSDLSIYTNISWCCIYLIVLPIVPLTSDFQRTWCATVHMLLT